MGVYVAVAKQSFRRQSTYRAAMIAGIFTNAVFGVILASVLLAAFESQTEINGLDANAAVTITFITQGMLLITRRAGARRTGRWALALHACGLVVLRRAARKLVIEGG